MKGSNLNIDKMLYDDATNIEIDMKFKDDLKKRIMASAVVKEKTVIELPRRSRTSYRKVAGWVVFAAISGSTIFGAGSLYSHLVANNSSVNPSVTEASKGQSESIKNNSENVAQNNLLPGNEKVTPTTPEKKVASIEGSSNPKGSISAAGRTNTNANAYVPPVSKPSSGTAAGGTNAGTEDTKGQTSSNAGTGTNTSGTPAQSNTVPEEKTNTINLPLVAGRYMIQGFTAAKSEVVAALPSDSEKVSAEEWAKFPIAETKGNVYEEDGSIYIVSHASQKSILVDKGQTPVQYAPINIISYIKNDTVTGDTLKSTTTSSVWVFDGNSATKYMLLSSDKNKYSYVNTSWSKDGQELYVLGLNRETNKYEIIKLTLEIK